MNSDETEKITLSLPAPLYHALRQQAYRQNMKLPEFIRNKIELKPADDLKPPHEGLASLSVKEMLARTKPVDFSVDERLDFFCG